VTTIQVSSILTDTTSQLLDRKTRGQKNLKSHIYSDYEILTDVWHLKSNSGNTKNQWTLNILGELDVGSAAALLNSHLVTDTHTIRQSGFELPRLQWSLLNHVPDCAGPLWRL